MSVMAKVPKKKLSKGDTRVLIAKDVIKQLKRKKIIVERGTYCFNPIFCNLKEMEELSELKKVLAKSKDKCYVCALGALFVSAVNRFNKYQITTDWAGIGKYETTNYLCKYFSDSQMGLIEDVFEFRCPVYMNSENHMINIMKNIIKNKGTFKPETE